MSDLVLARNCCLARMLPGEAENGVGMNRSVREGQKCKAPLAGKKNYVYLYSYDAYLPYRRGMQVDGEI